MTTTTNQVCRRPRSPYGSHLWWLTVSLALILNAFAGSVSAQQARAFVQVDRTEIAENETLSLTVSVARQVDTQQVDFSAVQNDFDVLSLNPSSQTQIINGRTSSETRWHLVLSPKRRGRLTIPQFDIDGTQTQVIEINVVEAKAVSSGELDLNATIELDRHQARPAEQIMATITLTAAENVRDLNGERLEVDNADVVFVDQREFRRTINGRSFNVVELRYAIFAQSQNEIRIPPQTFSGRLFTNRNRFDPFRRGERILARTQVQNITIDAPPSNQGHPWFPANDVRITSSWAGDKSALTVGQPLTRHIEIIAAGQRAAAIPPAATPPVDGVKQYDDQPQLSDTQIDTGIVGKRIQSAAIVATQPGEIELPEVRVHWYDITSDSFNVASLPPERLTIQPATGGPSPEPTIDESQQAAPVAVVNAPGTLLPVERVPMWLVIALVVASTLVVILAVAWSILYQQHTRLRWQLAAADLALTSTFEPETESMAWRHLQDAIAGELHTDIRNALLAWARIRWPNERIQSLQQIGQRWTADSDNAAKFVALLDVLDRRLYAVNANQPLDLAALNTLLRELRNQRSPKPKARVLPALYQAG